MNSIVPQLFTEQFITTCPIRVAMATWGEAEPGKGGIGRGESCSIWGGGPGRVGGTAGSVPSDFGFALRELGGSAGAG